MLYFQRQELDALIGQHLTHYKTLREQMTDLFFSFVEEYSAVFSQTDEMQYILVSCPLQRQFERFFKESKDPVYQDDSHCHYVDPPLNNDLIRFCQTHLLHCMFETIQSYSSYVYLPAHILTYELQKQYIPMTLLHKIVECVEPQTLPLLLPLTHKENAIHIAQLMLSHPRIKFPFFVNNVFITNWLIQQECSFEMLENMWNHGYAVRFPVCFPDQKLYRMDSNIIQWCFQKCGNHYPFDLHCDQMIMHPSYRDVEHFPLIFYSIRNGYFPSTTAFSVLLKKTNLKEKDPLFLDYVIQKLKKDEFDMDMWCDFAWQEEQDKTIELIMSFCTDATKTYLVIHLCMNVIDTLYANMDYWVLKFQASFSRYMKQIHLIRFMDHGKIRHVDPRIVEYVNHPQEVPSMLDISYPPMYERHPQTLYFYDQNANKIELPIYLSYLHSGLLSRIVDPQGFKRMEQEKDTIFLSMGLPEFFENPKKIMQRWLMVSYLQIIPLSCSIEEVIELFHLSQYLMDEECETRAINWLDKKYIQEFEQHSQHEQMNCCLCRFWRRSF